MKIILTLVLILLAFLSLFVAVDESALKIYEANFDRAIYSFALAKGLNAIIYVIQSSEVSATFIVGATVGIGQFLDPINDLVERFSWIMLASSVSIAIQNLLLVLGKSMFIKILLVVSILFSLANLWIKKLSIAYSLIFSLKIVLFVLVLRFGAVVFIYTTETFYNQVYANEYKISTQFIKGYKVELEQVKEQKKNLDGFWEKTKQNMENFSKKIVSLITIFIVTTVLLPLLFLWFLVSLLRWIFTLKFDESKIDLLLQK